MGKTEDRVPALKLNSSHPELAQFISMISLISVKPPLRDKIPSGGQMVTFNSLSTNPT